MSVSNATVPSVSCRLASVVRLSTETVENFDSESLAANPKQRVQFLRMAHAFALSGGSVLAAADKAMRVAIERPSDASALKALDSAERAKAEWLGTKLSIGRMFLAVPSLKGQEYGKTVDGDSLNGGHIATAIYGAFGKSDAKFTLKAMA